MTTKSRANELVNRLSDGGTLTDLELYELRLYFAPSSPKVAKTAIDWVAARVAKGQEWTVALPALHYWHVMNGIAYASNNEAMHWAVVDLKDGSYCSRTFDPAPFDLPFIDFPRMAATWDPYTPVSFPVNASQAGARGIWGYRFGRRFYDKKLVDLAAPKTLGVSRGGKLCGESAFGKFVIMPIAGL